MRMTQGMTRRTTIQESLILPKIPSEAISTIYNIGNIIEITTASRQYDHPTQYRKIDKDEYVNIETNKHSKGKTSQSSLSKTFTSLRRIINLNFVGDCTELFVTLMYVYFIEGTAQIRMDFKRFFLSLRYHVPVEYGGMYRTATVRHLAPARPSKANGRKTPNPFTANNG